MHETMRNNLKEPMDPLLELEHPQAYPIGPGQCPFDI